MAKSLNDEWCGKLGANSDDHCNYNDVVQTVACEANWSTRTLDIARMPSNCFATKWVLVVLREVELDTVLGLVGCGGLD